MVEPGEHGSGVHADGARGSGTYVPGYWLGHCEGFRVDDQNGPLGFVESIVSGDGARPIGLIVAERGSGGRRSYVPILHVAVVQPVRERVALDRSMTIRERGEENA